MIDARWICSLVVLVSASCSTFHGPLGLDRFEHETRHGLWVTRWDFKSAADVRAAIENAESIGITDVYWQVRGQGDALYESPHEPWSEDLAADGSAPGFDPLRVAVEEARARGVRIHAWVNIMPLWRGETPPKNAAHAYHAHPLWRLRDADGRPQALHDGYVVVNPVLDEVHDHIVRVVGDLVDRYRIDGVHLDYIRFLSDEVGSDRLMPGDLASRTRYARDTGAPADPVSIDRGAYRDWIRTRITDLVRGISHEVRRRDRIARLSAAVWRSPTLARERYLQDAARWVNSGLVDEVMPMIYTDDNAAYRRDLAAWLARVDASRVVPGIGVYKHADPEQTLDQIAIGRPRRFAIFAYSSVFDSPNPWQDDSAPTAARRERTRDSIRRLTTRLDGPT